MTARDVLIRAATLVVLGGAIVGAAVFQKPGTEGQTSPAGLEQAQSHAWFCPGLLPREGRREVVAVSNPGSELLTGRLTVAGDGKTVASRALEVPALGSVSVDVGDEISPQMAPAALTDSQSVGFVAVVELDGGTAAVGTGTAVTSGGVTDVAVVACSSRLSSRLALAGGSSVRGAYSDLFLANPLGDDSVWNVSLVTEKGRDVPPRLQKLPVLASSQASYRVSDESRRRWVLDVEADATAGESAGLLEVASDGTRIGSGIARIPSSAEASSVHIFPAYSNGSPDSSMLAVSNPLAEPRNVQVRIVSDDSSSPTIQGGFRTLDLQVPSEGAVTVTPSPGQPDGGRFGLVVEASDGKPVSASVFRRPGQGQQGLGITAGRPRGYTRWVLQDPADLGIPAGSRIEVSLMNVGDKNGSVKVTAFGSGTAASPAGLGEIEIARDRTVTIEVASLQLPQGVRSIVLDSDVPVVAEAALFLGGDQEQAGFDLFELHPVPAARPGLEDLARAGIGGATSSTVVFAVAFCAAAVLVYWLGRRKNRGDGGLAEFSASLREEVVLRLTEERGAAAGGQAVRGGIPGDILVLFSHEGCRACAAARELLGSVGAAHGAAVLEIRYESDREAFESAGVEDVPTTVLVSGNRVASVWVGPLSAPEVAAALNAGKTSSSGTFLGL